MDKYIGRLLDNRYEILEVIGTGGMAVVYKARCHRLNRLVAIKILKDDFLEDEDFRRRFHSESQAVAMLSHPNIVAVYDVSTSPEADYIVMELIEGISLKQYMEMKGVLNWKETLHFAIQIAKALEHAHSRGIVHRDIKPQNVMVLRDGSVKVADFGIACLENAAQTLTQEALGSVHYISPEQEEQHHHRRNRAAGDDGRLFPAAEAGGAFVLIAFLPPAVPLADRLPAREPVDCLGGRGVQQLSGLVRLLRPQIGELEIQVHPGVFPEGLQIGDHGVRRRVAAVQIRRHGLQADQLQLLLDVRIDLPGRQGDGAQVLDGNGHGAVPLKGQAAGEHLIEHHACGVDVAPCVDAVSPGLFRSNIMDRAYGLSIFLVHLVFQRSYAEISDFYCAVLQKHNVLRLYIPVDNTSLMGMRESLCHLLCEVQCFTPGHCAPLVHILS